MKKIVLITLFAICIPALQVEIAAAPPTSPVQMLRDLTQRLFPNHAEHFEFKLSTDSTDRFTLKSSNGKIIVSGNNAISMATGLNHYLKNYCLTNVSWEAVNPVIMPRKLPVLPHLVTGRAHVKQRFFLNYCTFGYTMPWWSWTEWERLIDWMALNGITMPLAITGEEAVWQAVWKRHGLTDEQVRTYFTGPAHLPWHRMSNVNGWQSPLPQDWIDGQVALQQRILQRERAFGMTPVLPAFGGSVPLIFKQMNPQADITQVSQWGGFAEQYRTYFLSPADPLYTTLQKEFIAEQTRLFGTDHVYCLDPFNEVQPPSWQPDILASMSRGIYQSLAESDPEAVWMQMGWFLFNDKKRWTPEITKAFLSAIPRGKLIMLDYYLDNTEIWKLTEKFYGHRYFACALANFGGNTMLQGDINLIASRLDDAIAHGGPGMQGIGATMEGFGVNPDYYEFVLAKAWDTGVTDEQWRNTMADRRVGYRSQAARNVWKTLFDTIMPSYVNESGTVVCAHPTFEARYMNKTYPATLLTLWKKLLNIDSDKQEYLFDLVNLGRQVLGDYFTFEKDGLARAYYAQNPDSLNYYADRMLAMLDDLDRLLACSEELSLRRWTESARSFGTTPQEKDYYEMNARTLISIWGDSNQLTDYANRTWAGMVSTYYKGRWELFINYARRAVASKTTFDEKNYKRALRKFEEAWVNPKATPISYPPSGDDAKKVSREIIGKWFSSLKLTAHNIDEVIKSMTLREKASLLIGGQNETYTGEGATIGFTKKSVPGAAGTTTAIPRLGIPSLVLADGPAGVRISPIRKNDDKTYYATGFPIGTSLACTWNPSLVEEVGRAIGNEVLEYGCDVLLAPGMNIHRNPLCGRNFEYFSEDPVLTGNIAAAYVKGIQNNGVGASIKHFAANSQETDRLTVDERVSRRALREIYLKGFEIAVKKGKPRTVMSSYNKLNGTYTQENRELLTDILRTEWGFKGIVITDWISIRNTAAQIHAGNDLMEPGGENQVEDIINKVENGILDIKDVDLCVKRVLETIVESPSFKGYPYSNTPDLKNHAQLTRAAGAEGMVLLKNDNHTLPLKHIREAALLGVNAYDLLSGGTGSGCVHTPYVINLVQGLKEKGITATDTLTRLYEKYIDYERLKFSVDKNRLMWFLDFGQPKYPEINMSRQCIIDEATRADAAVITLSRQSGEGLDLDAERDFMLNEAEQNLIRLTSEVFHQAGKPVIVIINSGTIIDISSWRDYADAILMAWQPGQEAGNSIADVLTGSVTPSGKLSMTWPISVYDHASTRNFPQDIPLYDYKARRERLLGLPNMEFTNHEEDIYVGYRYFDSFQKKVAYPFGHGLSYTTFTYEKLTAQQTDDKITLSIHIKNTGNYAGKEAVQIYVTAPENVQLEKPFQELKAFGKTKLLQPGESQTLQLAIDLKDLASFNEETGSWVADTGEYRIKAGASSRDIRCTIPLKITGMTEKVPNLLKPQVNLNILRRK